MKTHYLLNKDTYEFFVGYDPTDGTPRFYTSPTIAKKMAEVEADRLRYELPDRFRDQDLHRRNLIAQPIEDKVLYGRLLIYHLFPGGSRDMDGGKLLITRFDTPERRMEFDEIMTNERKDHTEKWLDLTEEDRANGLVEFVMPEHIGALTDSPILGFGTFWEDDGSLGEDEDSRFYWYPDYMLKDEFQELITKGYLIFDGAPENKKS